ncbi:hypothetical protein BC829DRAFT_401078 [Chytridium lagenaria]|nr:hypothetical protein BC829DRAFT_401078 [Chytridium lagenaria]
MHDVVMQRKDSTNSTTLDISSLSPPVQASDPSVYVTKYVRELVTNQDKRDVVVKALLDHKPYVETEFMAVAMIDISGFSTLTTLFTDLLGKLSSEVISAGTGEYIEKIAPIVLGYGGDIVKFLGDALLVTFCANDPFEDHASIKSRAIMCCTEILLEHPTHAIDVKRWANAMSSAKDPFDRYDSNGGTRNMKRSEVLTLHAAVACGMVSRVIIGLPSFRLDYFVVGDCLHEIGPLLDGTKSGQLGVSHQISEIFPESLSFLKDLEQIILYSEHLEAIRFSGSRSSQGHRGSITGTTTIKTIPVQSNIVDLDMSFLTTFINQSVMARMRDSDIVLSATQSSPAGLKRRVTDFKSEYRTLSVLFMKPLKAFGLEESQIYMEEFLKSLMTYNGVFLQSSVDDKGQTFLACFGLPPFANENGCHNAIKTAVMFQTALKRRVVGAKFSMSIATGSVFFGTVGTRGRKEAGFLGDVFNLAVRLLSIEREYRLIAIDRTTRDAVKNDFVCMHLGKHKVKGKGKQVDVWGIPSDGLGSRARRKKEFTDPMGNVDELEALKASFDAWRLGITRKNLALVEGTSGMGKSNLLAFLEKHISQFGMDHW